MDGVCVVQSRLVLQRMRDEQAARDRVDAERQEREREREREREKERERQREARAVAAAKVGNSRAFAAAKADLFFALISSSPEEHPQDTFLRVDWCDWSRRPRIRWLSVVAKSCWLLRRVGVNEPRHPRLAECKRAKRRPNKILATVDTPLLQKTARIHIVMI